MKPIDLIWPLRLPIFRGGLIFVLVHTKMKVHMIKRVIYDDDEQFIDRNWVFYLLLSLFLTIFSHDEDQYRLERTVMTKISID